MEAVDAATCILDSGADTLDILAVHLGMLDAEFSVIDAPELASHLRLLAGRYARAAAR